MGFLAGDEVLKDGVANLGLHDRLSQSFYLPLFPSYISSEETFAMEWVQEHIAAFGGDPKKVVMYVPTSLYELLINRYVIAVESVLVRCPRLSIYKEMLPAFQPPFVAHSWYLLLTSH
jgi:hypothetical protein